MDTHFAMFVMVHVPVVMVVVLVVVMLIVILVAKHIVGIHVGIIALLLQVCNLHNY
ncbi:hypothetical protein P0092_00965 [Ruminiclostridium papyrosolvens DSM 2782]|nr:hypothetical protein [Ruminiclostridium papyrosolvens]WES34581.1 hypothetical protein P0092_00965 [Ruminiclostridium papyrosolvens DSM 2782]